MKKNLLALAFFIPSLTVFSQQDSLLKNFKYRIDTYRAISFNAGGGSQYNKVELPAGRYESSSSSGAVGATYYALQSTDKILLTKSASIGSSFSFSSATNQATTDKVRSFSANPALSVLNKWFSKTKFIELGVDASGSLFSSKHVKAPTKSGEDEYDIQLNTGVGIGRLENVTDMQNAIWLSKALETANSLSNKLSPGQLNGLGRAITRANNTRVLDARKRTQFILATVDGYLQQEGLINKTDINYFSTLNDILFFAFNTPRLSGTEKFIRFTPGVSGFHRDDVQPGNPTKFDFKRWNRSLALSTGINKYTPTNLTHQNNYGAAVKFSYTTGNSTQRIIDNTGGINEFKSSGITRQAALNLFYDHAIYPNTRTIITFAFQSESGYEHQEDAHGFYGNANLYGSINYFISYRTRLNCNFGAQYQKNFYDAYPMLIGSPENVRLYANAGIDINL